MRRILSFLVIGVVVFCFSCASINVDVQVPKGKVARSELVSEVIDIIKSTSFYSSSLSADDINQLRERMEKSDKADFVSDAFSSIDKYAAYVESSKLHTIVPKGNPVVKRVLHEHQINYLQIKSFVNADFNPVALHEEINNALQGFHKNGLAKLIIDLRGNRGGYLDVAMKMLVKFAPIERALILRQDYGARADEVAYMSFYRGIYADWNIVVLVDHQSASSSEIVAGVLQHWGATIIGVQTYGIRIFSRTFFLSDGGLFKLSEGEYFIPGNDKQTKNLEGRGITPDIVIKSEHALEKAIEHLK